jgi:hypothetical protein
VADFTPGPWAISGDGFAIFPATTSGPIVARCNPIEDEPSDEEWVVAEANARLIAAAPDLLMALEPFATQGVSDTMMCHVGICSKEECGRCSQILSARAAIAKARGE